MKPTVKYLFTQGSKTLHKIIYADFLIVIIESEGVQKDPNTTRLYIWVVAFKIPFW